MDTFSSKHGYSYDYVLVFDKYEEDDSLTAEQKQFSMKNILHAITAGGLETKLFYSNDKKIVFCKIRGNVMRLKTEADRINYTLELDEVELEKVAAKGVPDKGIQPVRIDDVKHITKRQPYQNIFAPYSKNEDLQALYKKYTEHQMLFRGVDRLKLIHSILTARTGEGGCGLKLNRLVHDKCILSHYPLHESAQLHQLKDKWITWFTPPSQQPLTQVKDYFGEKIGLYFAWLGHYTSWLITPSIVGSIVLLNAFIDGHVDTASIPYFGLFMVFWSTFYLEYWKRRNATISMEWGMVGFESKEQSRPEFKGEKIPSPINGHAILYFNPWQKFRRVFLSFTFILFLMILVIGVVTGIFVFRYYSKPDHPLAATFTFNGVNYSGAVASTINAIQIQVMNMFYGTIAKKLNDFENHRTDTEYEDYLISKTFLFQFVNSYASCFYIAFIKQIVNESCAPDCMSELGVNLGIIFFLRLTSGNFTELVWPWAMNKLNRSGAPKGDSNLSAAQREYFLSVYDDLGTFADYSEMVIQFGYATLFVVSFPLAPLLALLNNYAEIRVDALKLCKETRRPHPRSAEDIGTWFSILQIMSTISVATNLALITFTSQHLSVYLTTTTSRLWFFIVLEHAVLLSKFLFSMYVADVPQDIFLQLQRASFLTDKFIVHIPDDKGDEIKVESTLLTSLHIHENDEEMEIQVTV